MHTEMQSTNRHASDVQRERKYVLVRLGCCLHLAAWFSFFFHFTNSNSHRSHRSMSFKINALALLNFWFEIDLAGPVNSKAVIVQCRGEMHLLKWKCHITGTSTGTPMREEHDCMYARTDMKRQALWWHFERARTTKNAFRLISSGRNISTSTSTVCHWKFTDLLLLLAIIIAVTFDMHKCYFKKWNGKMTNGSMHRSSEMQIMHTRAFHAWKLAFGGNSYHAASAKETRKHTHNN